MGGVHVQDVARHQPVEQHAQRGQVLLHRGRREFPLQLLDEGGDVEGLDAGELSDAAGLAPLREAARGIQVRLARVVVVDLGGEEFDHALRRLGRRREQREREARRGQGRG